MAECCPVAGTIGLRQQAGCLKTPAHTGIRGKGVEFLVRRDCDATFQRHADAPQPDTYV